MVKRQRKKSGKGNFFLFLGFLILAAGVVFYLRPRRGTVKRTVADQRSPLIGISKIVDHPALNDIERGLQNELSERGYTPHYDLGNAGGESEVAEKIAKRFLKKKVDIAVGISTPSALALAKVIQTIPVVFSGVTDPVEAGLLPSFDDPSGSNITGVSDFPPVDREVELIQKVFRPKVVGSIYNKREKNSVGIQKIIKKKMKETGIHFLSVPVKDKTEIQEVTASLIGRVDVLYLGNDNLLMANLDQVVPLTRKNKIPIFSSDVSIAERSLDISLAYGLNYYKIGVETGQIINEILKGKAPGDILMQLPVAGEHFMIFVDRELLKKLSYEVPDEIFRDSSFVLERGIR